MVEEDGNIYDAEYILAKRYRCGTPEYLVKWANYPLDECTWESYENVTLNGVMTIVEEFEARKNQIAQVIHSISSENDSPTLSSPERSSTDDIGSNNVDDVSPKLPSNQHVSSVSSSSSSSSSKKEQEKKEQERKQRSETLTETRKETKKDNKKRETKTREPKNESKTGKKRKVLFDDDDSSDEENEKQSKLTKLEPSSVPNVVNIPKVDSNPLSKVKKKPPTEVGSVKQPPFKIPKKNTTTPLSAKPTQPTLLSDLSIPKLSKSNNVEAVKIPSPSPIVNRIEPPTNISQPIQPTNSLMSAKNPPSTSPTINNSFGNAFNGGANSSIVTTLPNTQSGIITDPRLRANAATSVPSDPRLRAPSYMTKLNQGSTPTVQTTPNIPLFNAPISPSEMGRPPIVNTPRPNVTNQLFIPPRSPSEMGSNPNPPNTFKSTPFIAPISPNEISTNLSTQEIIRSNTSTYPSASNVPNRLITNTPYSSSTYVAPRSPSEIPPPNSQTSTFASLRSPSPVDTSSRRLGGISSTGQGSTSYTAPRSPTSMGSITSSTPRSPTKVRQSSLMEDFSDVHNFEEANEPTRYLWVGRFHSKTDYPTIYKDFEPFGEIDSVNFLREQNCAFINFSHLKDAIRAKQAMEGTRKYPRIAYQNRDKKSPSTLEPKPPRSTSRLSPSKPSSVPTNNATNVKVGGIAAFMQQHTKTKEEKEKKYEEDKQRFFSKQPTNQSNDEPTESIEKIIIKPEPTPKISSVETNNANSAPTNAKVGGIAAFMQQHTKAQQDKEQGFLERRNKFLASKGIDPSEIPLEEPSKKKKKVKKGESDNNSFLPPSSIQQPEVDLKSSFIPPRSPSEVSNQPYIPPSSQTNPVINSSLYVPPISQNVNNTISSISSIPKPTYIAPRSPSETTNSNPILTTNRNIISGVPSYIAPRSPSDTGATSFNSSSKFQTTPSYTAPRSPTQTTSNRYESSSSSYTAPRSPNQTYGSSSRYNTSSYDRSYGQPPIESYRRSSNDSSSSRSSSSYRRSSPRESTRSSYHPYSSSSSYRSSRESPYHSSYGRDDRDNDRYRYDDRTSHYSRGGSSRYDNFSRGSTPIHSNSNSRYEEDRYKSTSSRYNDGRHTPRSIHESPILETHRNERRLGDSNNTKTDPGTPASYDSSDSTTIDLLLSETVDITDISGKFNFQNITIEGVTNKPFTGLFDNNITIKGCTDWNFNLKGPVFNVFNKADPNGKNVLNSAIDKAATFLVEKRKCFYIKIDNKIYEGKFFLYPGCSEVRAGVGDCLPLDHPYFIGVLSYKRK